MAYQSNIPLAPDQLSISQADLLNNMSSISNYLNVNHVDFNGADQGKHFLLQMPVQATAPTVNIGEFGIFNLASALGTGVNQLSIISSAGVTTPFTAQGQTTNGGWYYMPNGLLVKYGFYNTLVQGSNVITFDSGAAIPAFTTAIFGAGCSTQSAVNSDVNFFVRQGTVTITSFQFWASQRTSTAPLSGFASASFYAIGI